jgi:hypothetical protein
MRLEPPTNFNPPPPMEITDTSEWTNMKRLQFQLGFNESFLERFYSKFVIGKPDECWEWLASTDKDGYGRLGIGQPHWRMLRANRIAYILANGYVPDELWVLHKCDNPLCVNPNHLFVGTATDNNRDTVAKGRHVNYNKLKTHCPQGHEYNEENITMWGGETNHRRCRICERIRSYLKRSLKRGYL